MNVAYLQAISSLSSDLSVEALRTGFPCCPRWSRFLWVKRVIFAQSLFRTHTRFRTLWSTEQLYETYISKHTSTQVNIKYDCRIYHKRRCGVVCQHHDGIVVRTQRKWEIYSYARVQVKWFFAEITCRWLCLIKERQMHVASKVTVNLYIESSWKLFWWGANL